MTDVLAFLKNPRGSISRGENLPMEVQDKAKELCWEYNHTRPKEKAARQEILKKLLGTWNDKIFIEPDFRCDYGFNLHFHGFAFVNYNCVMLDTAPIHIGKNAFIAPGVVLACPDHAIDGAQRAEGIEVNRPITLEDDVWLGANVTVCGGVTIGKGSVIGAGSVVTKNIPAGVVAAGVPCKVLRPITEKDKIDPGKIDF